MSRLTQEDHDVKHINSRVEVRCSDCDALRDTDEKKLLLPGGVKCPRCGGRMRRRGNEYPIENSSAPFQNGRQKALNDIKGWKHAGSDLVKARQQSADAAKEFTLHRLNGDGQPSKMYDAQKKFKSESEAIDHAARVRQSNPGKKLRYSLNGKEI